MALFWCCVLTSYLFSLSAAVLPPPSHPLNCNLSVFFVSRRLVNSILPRPIPFLTLLTLPLRSPVRFSSGHHGRRSRPFLGSVDLCDNSHIFWLCMACYAPGYASMVDGRKAFRIYHANATTSNHSVSNSPLPVATNC
jgi:hypothetical protein